MKDALRQNFDLVIDNNRVITPVNEILLKDSEISIKKQRDMSPDSN